MSAPTGNKYAEKWTYENTYAHLIAVLDSANDDDCLYLGQALATSGLYDDVWRYWKRKWRKQYEIIDIMKRIMQKFEVRLFTKMAKGEIPARVATFALTHHYGWGKEAEKKDPDYDEFDYIDKKIVREPKEGELEKLEESDRKLQALRMSDFPKKETPKQPEPTYDEDIMAMMRREYNRLNPQNQLTQSLPYYAGDPPAGFDVIRFKQGYFLKE